MASRSIDDLTPSMRELTVKFLDGCLREKIDVLIYCTLRSNQEQDSLYALGRTKPGAVVTNARAGQSSHNPDSKNKAHAFDCVPLLHGKPQWNDKATYLRMGAIAESVGLHWAGRWTGKLKESAHFSEDGK
jgi:peptidoglycan L-alanyl-D-glutamate endopeptidase CwlK